MGPGLPRAKWQHLEFCATALARVAPERVLDIGVGEGRWGVLVHQAGSPRAPHVMGLAVGESRLPPALRPLYETLDQLPPDGALDPDLPRCDLAIVDGVLTGLGREQGGQLLCRLLDRADYVLVVVELGPPAMSAVVAAQLPIEQASIWVEADFDRPEMRAGRVFHDGAARPYGAFILSTADPAGLAGGEWLRGLEGVGGGQGALWRVISQTRAELDQTSAELTAVINSRAWRTWTKLRLSGAGRLAGGVRRALRGAAPAQPTRATTMPATESGKPPSEPPVQAIERQLLSLDLPAGGWLALHHPGWPGVTASTINLFDYTLGLGEVPQGEAVPVAKALLASGCRQFVLSGFVKGWRGLTESLKRLDPAVRILALTHSSTTQMAYEVLADEMFELIELCRAGAIEKVGFVKEDLAEVFGRAGIRTAFVMNYLRVPIAERAAPPADGRQHLGLLAATVEIRKNNFTQLAAAAMLDNAVVYLLPSHPALERFAGYLGLPCVAVASKPIPRPEALAVMGRMSLTLSVTLSECCPMSVLESLSLGVPVLMGATSHLFRDDEYLHRRLCVQFHDNPVEIARAGRRAIEERAQIVKAYDAYIPGYNERARRSVQAFLEDG